jgi:hypothetical protein
VWFWELNATQSVSQWDKFVKAIQARFWARENVENLEQVKDEKEVKRDEETTDSVGEFVKAIQERF